ncbi:3-oxoacyl-[acyl-carrier-protein] synthase III [Desulfonispora thiosulfatigenes DSM 11270]|uniref:Beta-ketoacyl-[acyl-carrier-protein] synthase III n=1 Tax=Desulfonispora thiosulfatigenes DSM 11270 TaxID=656914 RepID=A0A1W1VJZ5_DESTI|nr:beta-ketoacyl-ACP synthase III [Desulfonispora thiosulfatigenes]SMB93603.1 3-oxoacyl-[acyl-carrier-protein] synthase III [Desulfonispora thiosulfatigenes DSM 11270]
MDIKLLPVGVIGTGSYLPDMVITNKDLEKMVDTNDEWITSRTGIKERRKADCEKSTSYMASMAAKKALENANVKAEEIDMIIVATITPDMFFPSTACLVQEQIGAVNAAAVDLGAACTGFIYSLAFASNLISTGMYKKILVIGSETLTRILDPKDRNTLVLFGDGAGACVLSQVEEGSGFLSFDLGSDGKGANLLYSSATINSESVAKGDHYLKMAGNEVFKFAIRILNETAQKALEKAGLTKEELDFLVPHQANKRIIQSAMKRLDISEDKVYVNLDKYGNMSGASIPVALDEAVRNGKVKKGDNIILVGFGAGLTWGSCVIRWV